MSSNIKDGIFESFYIVDFKIITAAHTLKNRKLIGAYRASNWLNSHIVSSLRDSSH